MKYMMLKILLMIFMSNILNSQIEIFHPETKASLENLYFNYNNYSQNSNNIALKINLNKEKEQFHQITYNQNILLVSLGYIYNDREINYNLKLTSLFHLYSYYFNYNIPSDIRDERMFYTYNPLYIEPLKFYIIYNALDLSYNQLLRKDFSWSSLSFVLMFNGIREAYSINLINKYNLKLIYNSSITSMNPGDIFGIDKLTTTYDHRLQLTANYRNEVLKSEFHLSSYYRNLTASGLPDEFNSEFEYRYFFEPFSVTLGAGYRDIIFATRNYEWTTFKIGLTWHDIFDWTIK